MGSGCAKMKNTSHPQKNENSTNLRVKGNNNEDNGKKDPEK